MTDEPMNLRALERSPSELNRGRDSRIGFDLLEDCRRAKGAAGDGAFQRSSRTRCGGSGGRRHVAQRGSQAFWGQHRERRALGGTLQSQRRGLAGSDGGDRRSGRIEAHRDYLLGLIRRRPDMRLLEIQERLIANCGERFSSSVLWRFFDRHEITCKKSLRMPRSSNARTL